MKYRILLVDDDDQNLKATAALLEEWDYNVECATNGRSGIEKLRSAKREFAVVLLDYKMPVMNGAETAAAMRAINAETIIIVYSCDTRRASVKEAFRAGAIDFIDKDESVDTLRTALDLACQKYEDNLRVHEARVNKAYNADLLRSVGMIGQSQKMAEVAHRCLTYRTSTSPVLILGETGVGKELVARAIHGGPRATFFAVNCAAFADGQLIESELFGYERGAFTGAVTRKVGILEAAGRGTVFLDELHHMSLKAQGTLLRAIREKRIRRVGGTVESPIACRILAASKPDLLRRVEAGLFLPDLYYRLKFLTIDVPPLRERPEDVGLFVDFFSKKFAKETGREINFRAKVIRIFEKFSWPGNVGELEGYISHLLVNAKKDVVGPSDLDDRFRPSALLENPSSTLADLDSKHEEERREMVIRAIRMAASRRQAAQRLGINESSLRTIIERQKITDDELNPVFEHRSGPEPKWSPDFLVRLAE